MKDMELVKAANRVRKGILTAVHSAGSGHPGGSLSAADMFTYLYFRELRINPDNPRWSGRDRVVLSKGHTAPGLYSALAHRGYFPVEELGTLRRVGSHLQGHPCMQETRGVDASTGSLGQGFSVAVGMALAAKLDNRDYRTYCICGDGELQEGQIWEASMFAGHRKLDNLVLIIDNNGLQIDGNVAEICSPYPIDDKLAAFNFHVITINGHDMKEIASALDEARRQKGVPSAIIMNTVKGKGVSFMENQAGWHGKAPSDMEYEQGMKELDIQLERELAEVK